MTLALKGVTLRVGADIHIYETSVELDEGGFNILLGTTLSGKTTLMRLMAGLLKPTRGEVWFGGKNVTGVPVRRRNVAMVYQQFINYPNMSVFENIASPLRVEGESADKIKTRVGAIAELLKLSPLLERRPMELSGGQQQRTALARALVKEADLVLLDEPLANLDYKLREALRDELPKLFAGRHSTVVYATSEPGEALLLGGHTAALHEGRIVQFGPTAEVYRQPADRTAAAVFSDPPINFAEVVTKSDRIELGDGTGWPASGALKGLADGAYTMGLRPHFVLPGGANGGGVPVEGRVSIAEISGSESVVHFDAHGVSWVSQAHGVRGYDAGAQARFMLDVSRALYFGSDGRLVHAAGSA